MQSQGIPNIRPVSPETSGERKTMLNRKVKPIAALIGTAFVASLATANVANAGELFTTTALDTGYDLLAQADAEGKCGEGKCGEDKAEGEGKCGEDKAEGEGKCGEDKAEGEGKCGEDKAEGEGKCGEAK